MSDNTSVMEDEMGKAVALKFKQNLNTPTKALFHRLWRLVVPLSSSLTYEERKILLQKQLFKEKGLKRGKIACSQTQAFISHIGRHLQNQWKMKNGKAMWNYNPLSFDSDRN